MSESLHDKNCIYYNQQFPVYYNYMCVCRYIIGEEYNWKKIFRNNLIEAIYD